MSRNPYIVCNQKPFLRMCPHCKGTGYANDEYNNTFGWWIPEPLGCPICTHVDGELWWEPEYLGSVSMRPQDASRVECTLGETWDQAKFDSLLETLKVKFDAWYRE